LNQTCGQYKRVAGMPFQDIGDSEIAKHLSLGRIWLGTTKVHQGLALLTQLFVLVDQRGAWSAATKVGRCGVGQGLADQAFAGLANKGWLRPRSKPCIGPWPTSLIRLESNCFRPLS
jgi:hypothetical protein